MQELLNKRIVLGLSGGIACYKSAELVRRLIEQGATVDVIMTDAATHFITAVTMQALSGRPVFTDAWDPRIPNNMAHIDLSRGADAILIAPASADFMAKLAQGRADDLLSTLCLARACPLLVAPAMNREMWSAAPTQRNVAQLVADGVAVSSAQPHAASETLGVNSRNQLAELERAHQTNIAGELMGRGVTLADPARIDVRGHLACGRDVAIDVNCVFEGEVALGDRVTVGAHCVLKNVRIAAGTRIEPFCHLEDADIGAHCRVGPYARIRPGTVLAEDVHVGNFVEVKASSIGRGSKANHLAYIGDSEVGRNVNVGAGTITCNYDGAGKHRTVIEDDVFIGSDTQLVAPVRVGRGATLGAGTTLTRDAPAGQLTVSRARQVSIPGWKRPTKKK